MKFLLMLFAEEKVGASIAPEDMARAMETMSAYQTALTKAGAFVATAALLPTWDAKTLRMEGGEIRLEKNAKGTAPYFVNEGGELKVHDGPYAETREQLGGYFIIEVPDMDAALKWAARCPAAQWGPIEVRPYREGY